MSIGWVGHLRVRERLFTDELHNWIGHLVCNHSQDLSTAYAVKEVLQIKLPDVLSFDYFGKDLLSCGQRSLSRLEPVLGLGQSMAECEHKNVVE